MGSYMSVRRFLRQIFALSEAFFCGGFQAARNEIRNQKGVWSIPHKVVSGAIISNTTSLSDSTEYLDVCNLALMDPEVFATFKSNYEYRKILEHVTFRQGKRYLECVVNNSSIVENLKDISMSEEGGPFKYQYQNLGVISPTQIRYAKVLYDLNLLFSDLRNFRICEIGVGNGGQAIHILNYWKNIEYFGFDLELVLKLSDKLIHNFDKTFKFQSLRSGFVPESTFDLLISNYAYSELTRELQEFYLDLIVSNSKRGYVIFNHIQSENSKSLTAFEFSSRIPGSEIFQENPKTFKGNVLVAWGHNQNLPETLFIRV